MANESGALVLPSMPDTIHMHGKHMLPFRDENPPQPVS